MTELKQYKEQVALNRDKLKELEIKNPLHYFALKFPEFHYKNRKTPEFHKLDNLWYGKTKDEEFLKKMNCFVNYKSTEFKN